MLARSQGVCSLQGMQDMQGIKGRVLRAGHKGRGHPSSQDSQRHRQQCQSTRAEPRAPAGRWAAGP